MSDTREHILQTAFSLFLQRSFKAVTMSELEKATGLTKGAFYHYFKSKEEIFIEVINKYYFPSQTFKTCEGLEKIDNLHTFFEYRLKYFREGLENIKKLAKIELPDPFYFTLLHEVREYYPNFYEKAKKFIQSESIQWERVIVKAKEKGEILPDIEAFILAETFISLEMGIMRIINQKKSIDYALNILKMQFEQLYHLIHI